MLVAISVYTIAVFCLLIVTLSLNLPQGMFVPLLAVGAGVGRIVGEFAKLLWPDIAPGGGRVRWPLLLLLLSLF